jgi:hypothetical protein
MPLYNSSLTEKNKRDILALFYRTKLYQNEKVIDNRDYVIAKKLDLKTSAVGYFLYEQLNKKYKKLNKKINNE